jgi:manganese oxidase
VLGVVASLALVSSPAHGATKHYWIAAVPQTWNIVPSGRDPISGMTFPAEDTTMETVLFKRFTRNWASAWRNRSVVGDNDGIPGPTIRARVGDTVVVHFRNQDTERPHSMHFHGFRYAFPSDGSFIPGSSGPGGNVQPGRSFTYRLVARPGSRGVWSYHDHSATMHESIMGGMYGASSILGRRERRPTRENIVFFSHHRGFETVNGRAFIRNTPTFRARVGDLVQWSVLAIGNEFHTFHLHGHRWRSGSEFIDTRTIGPGESFRFRIREDVPGTWLYHCHVENHIRAGMEGLYRVTRRATATAAFAGR